MSALEYAVDERLSAVPRRRSTPGLVRLLDVEPAIGARLPAPAQEAARRQLAVPALDLPTGPWAPKQVLQRATAVVIMRGLIVGRSTAFGYPTLRLLGSEDIVAAPALLATRAWRVVEPARLAIIDARFLLAARRWPPLVSGLLDRLFECQQEQETFAAIARMARVEERILALMARLAARWGTMTTRGLVVSLPVTHATLGQMVGARRPTVTLALGALREDGLLDRHEDGRWILPPSAAEWEQVGVPDRRAVAVTS